MQCNIFLCFSFDGQSLFLAFTFVCVFSFLVLGEGAWQTGFVNYDIHLSCGLALLFLGQIARVESAVQRFMHGTYIDIYVIKYVIK